MPESSTSKSSDSTTLDSTLLQRRAEYYARRSKSQLELELVTLLRFQRGQSRFALPLDALRAVRVISGFRAIPGAARKAPGVVHFRGEILSVHDLATLFDTEGSASEELWALIVTHPDGDFAFLADFVDEVADFDRASFEPPPTTFGELAALMSAVLPAGDIVIDIEAFRGMPQAFDAF